MSKIKTVVFPVAGMGTRFLPATKSTAKEMLPVVDKPLIQYAAEEAVEAGAQTLVFVTSRKKHAISDHFDKAFELEHKLEQGGKTEQLASVRETIPEHVDRTFVIQPEALGLGHAVLCANPVVDNQAFGLILADDMVRHPPMGCLAQMAQIHEETGASVIGVEEVPRDQTHRYGIVATEPHGERTERIVSIVEKPKPEDAPSNLAVVGRYILSGRIMELLKTTKPGAGGEIQLTDAIAELLAEEPVYAYRFKGQRYDCGNKFGFVQATVEYALDHPETRDQMKAYLQSLKNAD